LKVEITYQIALRDSGNPLSLRIPVPANTGYQNVLSRRHEGNCALALYARWDAGAENKALTVGIEVETRERRMPLAHAGQADALPDEVRPFLAPTAHIPTDGIVRQRAEEIVAGRNSPLEKSRATRAISC